MDILTVYALIMVPTLGELIKFLTIVGGFLLAVCWFIWLTTDDKAEEASPEAAFRSAWLKLRSKLLTLVIILMFVGTAIPTQSQWYTIIGGYYAANLEGVADMPANVVAAMNTFLEQYAGGGE